MKRYALDIQGVKLDATGAMTTNSTDNIKVPINEASASRECSLIEYIKLLPKNHQARLEFNELCQASSAALSDHKADERDLHGLRRNVREFDFSATVKRLNLILVKLAKEIESGPL